MTALAGFKLARMVNELASHNSGWQRSAWHKTDGRYAGPAECFENLSCRTTLGPFAEAHTVDMVALRIDGGRLRNGNAWDGPQEWIGLARLWPDVDDPDSMDAATLEIRADYGEPFSTADAVKLAMDQMLIDDPATHTYQIRLVPMSDNAWRDPTRAARVYRAKAGRWQPIWDYLR